METPATSWAGVSLVPLSSLRKSERRFCGRSLGISQVFSGVDTGSIPVGMSLPGAKP